MDDQRKKNKEKKDEVPIFQPVTEKVLLAELMVIVLSHIPGRVAIRSCLTLS
jgi:hypothetical protein